MFYVVLMCRPDLLVLGKALSGGVMPVSAVLADDQVHFGVWKKGSSGEVLYISRHLNKKQGIANCLNIRPQNLNRDRQKFEQPEKDPAKFWPDLRKKGRKGAVFKVGFNDLLFSPVTG